MNKYYFYIGPLKKLPEGTKFKVAEIYHLSINEPGVGPRTRLRIYASDNVDDPWDEHVVWNIPDDWLLINKLKDDIKLFNLVGLTSVFEDAIMNTTAIIKIENKSIVVVNSYLS